MHHNRVRAEFVAKLYSGAGDGIDHSSVRPSSQGSLVALRGFADVTTILIKNTIVPIPIKNAPMVLIKFKLLKPLSIQIREYPARHPHQTKEMLYEEC